MFNPSDLMTVKRDGFEFVQVRPDAQILDTDEDGNAIDVTAWTLPGDDPNHRCAWSELICASLDATYFARQCVSHELCTHIVFGSLEDVSAPSILAALAPRPVRRSREYLTARESLLVEWDQRQDMTAAAEVAAA